MCKRPCTNQPGRKSQAAGPGVTCPARGLHVAAGVGHRLTDTLARRPAIPTSALCVFAAGGLSLEPLFPHHPLESFCSDVYKKQAWGCSMNSTIPSVGFGGPRSLSWPVNSALGSAFVAQRWQPVGEALPASAASLLACPLLPTTPTAAPAPCLCTTLLLVWKACPRQQTLHKIPAWPVPASGSFHLPALEPAWASGCVLPRLKAWGAEAVSVFRS